MSLLLAKPYNQYQSYKAGEYITFEGNNYYIALRDSAKQQSPKTASNNWQQVFTGGGAPSGAAGGDLSGTYPNPTVAKVLNNTVPANAAGALTNNGAGVLSWTPAGTGTITGSGTANEITYFTAATVIASLTTATYPSLTELAFLKGVTSAIQTQLNAKLSTALATGKIFRGDDSNVAVASTATFADTYTASNLLYSNGANTVTGLATANDGILITSATGVPSIATAIPNGVTATTQTDGDNTAKVATDLFVTSMPTGIMNVSSASQSPADNTIYYFGTFPQLQPTTTANARRIYPPFACTIDTMNIYAFLGTGGSAELSTFYVRKNGTTDSAGVTLAMTANPCTAFGTGLAMTFNGTSDYFEAKWQTPVAGWVTNPANVIMTATFGYKRV